MLSKTSAEEIMHRYEGCQVTVYDGRVECNSTDGYIVDVGVDYMVICHDRSPEWQEYEHHLIALNTIVEVHVFSKP